MFSWRLKLFEASRAVRAGRLEDARRLLADAELREFAPAKRLAEDLAQQMTERARSRFAYGESSAGFADLDAARRLGAREDLVDQARREYAARVADEAVALLAAGDPTGARRALDRALRRGVESARLRTTRELAEQWRACRESADVGRLDEAVRQAARAAALARAAGAGITMEATTALEAERTALAGRAAAHAEASRRLRDASAAGDWPAALGAADDALRAAPLDRGAAALRHKAWAELGGAPTRHPTNSAPRQTPWALRAEGVRRLSRAIRETSAAIHNPTHETRQGGGRPDRRMLWIDAVGGFLLCLDDIVVLGQPGGDPSVAAPILADLSRRHALLRREGGCYILEPLATTLLDGEPLTGPAVLADSHLLQLGGSVKLRFTRPHALSASARLEVVSGHRTAPAADAIVLMADTCVLGPKGHSHVVCRRWERDIVLVRQGDRITCRAPGGVTVNGEAHAGAAPLPGGSRVEGEDFALSIEEA